MDTVTQIFWDFGSIGAISSTTDKAKILTQLATNRETHTIAAEMLEATYNPFRVYYNTVKVPTFPPSNDTPLISTWDQFKTILSLLESRKIRGSAATKTIQDFMNSVSPLAQIWYSRILNKDLEIGIAENTVLKAFPKLFPHFKPQKGEAWDLQFHSVKKPMLGQPKYDGYRTLAFKRNGVVSMLSFTGNPQENVDAIIDALQAAPYDNFLIEGEVWSPTYGFKAVQKTLKTTDPKKREAYKDIISTLRFAVFDAQPVFDWDFQTGYKREIERYLEAVKFTKLINSPLVHEAPTVWIKNDDELATEFQKQVEAGFEGLMLKDPDAIYAYKRAQNWWKVKDFYEGDFTITGAYEGDEPATIGSLGGINIQGPITWRNGDYNIECNVGGGFKLTNRNGISRDELWTLHKQGQLAGKMAEIKFQEITIDEKTKKWALRFPTFLRLRDDK